MEREWIFYLIINLLELMRMNFFLLKLNPSWNSPNDSIRRRILGDWNKFARIQGNVNYDNLSEFKKIRELEFRGTGGNVRDGNSPELIFKDPRGLQPTGGLGFKSATNIVRNMLFPNLSLPLFDQFSQISFPFQFRILKIQFKEV